MGLHFKAYSLVKSLKMRSNLKGEMLSEWECWYYIGRL